MTFTQGWEGPKAYAVQWGQPVRADWTAPAPEIGIVPLRPLGPGNILGGAFKAVRYNPLVMFGLTVLVVLVAQLLGTLATYVFGSQLGFSMVPFDDLGTADPLGGLGFSASLLASTAVTTLASLVVNMGLMFATAEAVSARRVRPLDALRHMGRRMWPALALAGLQGLAIVLVLAAGAGLIALVAANGDAGSVVGLTLLLLLVVGVPAIWLSIRLLFAPCAIAIERLGPFRAMARSWELSRGMFWRILGISLLVNIIVGMASGTISQVFSFTAMLLAFSSSQLWTVLAVTTVSTVVSAALTLPLTGAATALLYVDARIRREGFDITLSEAMYG